MEAPRPKVLGLVFYLLLFLFKFLFLGGKGGFRELVLRLTNGRHPVGGQIVSPPNSYIILNVGCIHYIFLSYSARAPLFIARSMGR
jgi:hypothetical protein